jgi:hypothetical protein
MSLYGFIDSLVDGGSRFLARLLLVDSEVISGLQVPDMTYSNHQEVTCSQTAVASSSKASP